MGIQHSGRRKGGWHKVTTIYDCYRPYSWVSQPSSVCRKSGHNGWWRVRWLCSVVLLLFVALHFTVNDRCIYAGVCRFVHNACRYTRPAKDAGVSIWVTWRQPLSPPSSSAGPTQKTWSMMMTASTPGLLKPLYHWILTVLTELLLHLKGNRYISCFRAVAYNKEIEKKERKKRKESECVALIHQEIR